MNADRWIAQWFHAHATPGLTRWMLVVTHAFSDVAAAAAWSTAWVVVWLVGVDAPGLK